MTRAGTVAIVGLGLMGGSLARDLAARGTRVLGHDAEPGRAQQARSDGMIDAVLDDSFAGVRDAELVIIATPVDAALGVLERLVTVLPLDATVTDLGSTKARIVDLAGRLGIGRQFVGSHPMTGTHRSGWEASRAGLYEGAPVHLCPTATTSPDSLARVERLWREVGAVSGVVDAAAHDELLAWVSHLPQVASSALAAALADSGRLPAQLGPGGRDVTRLAASSPEMWSAICLDNDVAIRQAVRAFEARLAEFDEALVRRDVHALRRFFATGRSWLS